MRAHAPLPGIGIFHDLQGASASQNVHSGANSGCSLAPAAIPVCDGFEALLCTEIPAPQVHLLLALIIHASKHIEAVAMRHHGCACRHNLCNATHQLTSNQVCMSACQMPHSHACGDSLKTTLWETPRHSSKPAQMSQQKPGCRLWMLFCKACF